MIGDFNPVSFLKNEVGKSIKQSETCMVVTFTDKEIKDLYEFSQMHKDKDHRTTLVVRENSVADIKHATATCDFYDAKKDPTLEIIFADITDYKSW